MEIQIATTVNDIIFCKDLILSFRPNLDPATFVEQLHRMMLAECFNLAYIPDESGMKAAAFIGYRTPCMLRKGKMIYIDDLFTAEEHRGKGYAGALLDHVAKVAEHLGIASGHLDSGYSLHDALRLYLNRDTSLPLTISQNE